MFETIVEGRSAGQPDSCELLDENLWAWGICGYRKLPSFPNDNNIFNLPCAALNFLFFAATSLLSTSQRSYPNFDGLLVMFRVRTD